VIPLSWSSSDDYKLLKRLEVKLQGAVYNAAFSIGEGALTVKMLQSTVTKLAKAFLQLRSGNLLTAAGILLGGDPLPSRRFHTRHVQEWAQRTGKVPAFSARYRNTPSEALANNWLELSYGWIPLLSDVQHAAEWLAATSMRPTTNRYSASSAISVNGPLYTSPKPWWGWAKHWRKISHRIICQTGEDFSLSSIEELGLVDPLSLAWELLPFSFVVDWFTPIQDYLQVRHLLSQKLKNQLFVVSTKEVYGYRGVVNGVATGFDASANWQFGSGASLCEDVTTKLTRTVQYGLTAQLPDLPSGSAFGISSWRHTLSGLALLR